MKTPSEMLLALVIGIGLSSLALANPVVYSGDQLPELSTPAWQKSIPNNNDAILFADDPHLLSYPHLFDYQGLDDYLLPLEQANGVFKYQVHQNADDYNGQVCDQCHSVLPTSTNPAMLRDNINFWPVSYQQESTTLDNSVGTTITARLRAVSSSADVGIAIDDGVVHETLFIKPYNDGLSTKLILLGGGVYHGDDYDLRLNSFTRVEDHINGFNSSEFHTYRMVVKDFQVKVYVDCTLVLDTQTMLNSTDKRVRFGAASDHNVALTQDVEWDSVAYQSGDLGAGNCGANMTPGANAGEDLVVSTDQLAGVVITGSASDEDPGDTLSCRWLYQGTVLQDWAFVDGLGQCPLVVDAFTPGIGMYPLTLEVTDGIETSADTMLFSVINTTPTVMPSGAGTYVLGSMVTLGGTVFDFDGDIVYFRWSDETGQSYSGSVNTVVGGAPVSLPEASVNFFPLGDNVLTLMISDSINPVVSQSITVTIVAPTP